MQLLQYILHIIIALLKCLCKATLVMGTLLILFSALVAEYIYDSVEKHTS